MLSFNTANLASELESKTDKNTENITFITLEIGGYCMIERSRILAVRREDIRYIRDSSSFRVATNSGSIAAFYIFRNMPLEVEEIEKLCY